MEQDEVRILKDGRYHSSRLLGEGSMGRTYLAMDQETGIEVAVKALYPSRLASLKDLELFKREANILQRLDHPQIPAYIDAFHEGEGDAMCYFLVQTYVKGTTLRELIDRSERFDEARLVAFGMKLLDVLGHIHGCDPTVVHRDIKPANIIVCNDGTLPTLVDFGAVREVVRLTMGGGSTIIGTFGYMPPEQLMGQAVPATDLYAMGITLLECLTRRTPSDLHGVDARRMIDELNVSEDFKRILRRLCAPIRSERYASAEQVRADLERLSEQRALVHAGSIEGEIAVREKQEARELARATSPGISLLFAVTGLIALLSLVAGILFLFQALAQGFEDRFLLAGTLTLGGALVPFYFMVRRYIHDSWFPPAADWIKTRGEIVRVEEIAEFDQNNVPQYFWFACFEFDTRRGTHEAKFKIGRKLDGRRFYKGLSFDVYFPPGHPERYETQDFSHPDFHKQTTDLFDRTVEHTPG